MPPSSMSFEQKTQDAPHTHAHLHTDAHTHTTYLFVFLYRPNNGVGGDCLARLQRARVAALLMKLTRVCMWVRVKSNKHDSHNKHYKQQHTNTTSRRRTYSTAQDTQRPVHNRNAAHNTTQRTQRATHCIFWHKGDFDPCFGLFFDLAFFTNVEDMGASSTMSKTCRRGLPSHMTTSSPESVFWQL